MIWATVRILLPRDGRFVRDLARVNDLYEEPLSGSAIVRSQTASGVKLGIPHDLPEVAVEVAEVPEVNAPGAVVRFAGQRGARLLGPVLQSRFCDLIGPVRIRPDSPPWR